MTESLLRQLMRVPVLCILLTLLVFFGLHTGPRTPTASIGVDLAEERRLSIGGDVSFRPELLGEYVSWLGHATQGDLGESASYDEPVTSLIIDRARRSLVLLALSLTAAIAAGILVSARSLRRPRSAATRLTSILSHFGTAVPCFVLGSALLYIFRDHETLLPLSNFASREPFTVEWASGPILPVAALTLPIAAVFVRFARSELLKTLNLNHVRTARGKGLPEERVFWTHQFRPILSPLFSGLPHMALHITGALIAVELPFDIPGLGNLVLEAAGRRDFALLQGIVLLVGCFMIGLSLLVQTTSILLDPRLRTGSSPTAFQTRPRIFQSNQLKSRKISRQRLPVALPLFGLWMLFAFTAPRFIGHNPGDVTFDQRFRPPDLTHLLGTDDQGRDVLVRALYGLQHSFKVGMVVTVVVLAAGLFLGILSGSNRHVAAGLLAILEVINLIPPILFVITLLLIYDGNLSTLIVAIALSTLPPIVDTIAFQFRQVRASDFIEAARATGVTQTRIVLRYLLPGSIAVGFAQFGSLFANAVVIDATISFLGFNPLPESISLGEMINYSRLFMASAPWALVAPAAALTVTLLLAQSLGRGMRTGLNPEFQLLLAHPDPPVRS